MNPVELIFGGLLAALLIALAGFFAWRQRRTLHLLRTDTTLSNDDRQYLRNQVRRRLLSSVLMVVFAGFLVGSGFLAPEFHRLHGELDQPPAWPQDEDASWDFLQFFTAYWIAALMVLAAIVLLALLDLAATARYGMRHQRQLLNDHRDMLEAEAARIRRRRAEMN